MKALLLQGALVLLILVGVVSCKVSVWRECRTDHTFLYCLNMMGK